MRLRWRRRRRPFSLWQAALMLLFVIAIMGLWKYYALKLGLNEP